MSVPSCQISACSVDLTNHNHTGELPNDFQEVTFNCFTVLYILVSGEVCALMRALLVFYCDKSINIDRDSSPWRCVVLFTMTLWGLIRCSCDDNNTASPTVVLADVAWSIVAARVFYRLNARLTTGDYLRLTITAVALAAATSADDAAIASCLLFDSRPGPFEIFSNRIE